MFQRLRAAFGRFAAPETARGETAAVEPAQVAPVDEECQFEADDPTTSPIECSDVDEASDPPLRALLEVCSPSARLRHLLQNTSLGATSVRAYELGRDEIERWMLAQPNCGRRSVNDLRSLTPLLHSNYPPPTPELSKNGGSVESFLASLLEHDIPMGGHTLDELLIPETLSVRLANVMTAIDLGSMTFLAYLQNRQQLEARMLRHRNCGRRTVNELRAALAARAQQEFGNAGLAEDVFEGTISSTMDALPCEPPVDLAPPLCSSVREVVVWHLERLPPRTAQILTWRFGLDCQSQTLAEIGVTYDITRERVRQIEAKAIRRIRAICRRHPIDDRLDGVRSEFVGEMFAKAAHVTSAHLDASIRALDGHVLLALEFTCLDPHDWFAQSATRCGRGWLRPGLGENDVSSVAEGLRYAYAGRPFPRAAAEMVGERDAELVFAAAELLLGWVLAQSYFFDRRPRARLLRTASLHALLSLLNEPTDVSDLLMKYTAAVPSDRCLDRDLVIVMEVASHLFLETSEGCWAAVGRAGELSVSAQEEILPVQNDVRDLDDATIAFSLETELRRRGPTRVGQLINRASDIIPDGRSANSVGPTLLLHPSRFVRVLPGVYALPDQVLDEHALGRAVDLEYLLNPQQARLFALARWAGEPWGAYPLWTIGAEVRLCRWARGAREDDLLRSLLAVASIDQWPTDEADREQWRDLQRRQGRFELEFAPRRLASEIPLDRVLAAGLHLRATRSLGWMTANRIMGHGPKASVAAALLSGMAKIGMVAGPCDDASWQRPHSAGEALDEWIDRLSSELHLKGELLWNGETGALLAPAFEQRNQAEPDDEPEAEDELDEFDRLMMEHRRSVQSRRQEARIEMALE